MSNKKQLRHEKILGLLEQQTQMDVTALAAELGVSQVTMRQDLDTLESQGLVTRSHGIAILASPDDLGGRLAYHLEAKREIATRAAALVKDGDTIMIESGSCCALLAEALGREQKHVTIVTNSAFIADFVKDYATLQVVLFGGIYQPASKCLVGPFVAQTAANYHVRYLFIGTDGWTAAAGFSNKDLLRVQAVRDMARSADCLAILTESEKFHRPGTVPLNINGQPKLVITDKNIPADCKAQLERDGIDVLLADAGR